MLGKLEGFHHEGNTIFLTFENGKGQINIINPWVVNIFSPVSSSKRFSRAVENLCIETCDVKTNQQNSVLVITTDALEIKVFDDFLVDFYDNSGAPLCEDYRGERNPFIRRGNTGIAEEEGHSTMKNASRHKVEVLKKISGDEKFYGLGESTGHLNKRGTELVMWNSDDPRPHVESYKSLYKSIPFFITLKETTAFGIFFDNTFKSYFNMAKESSEYYYFGADDGNLNYYFIAGPQIHQVVKRYTDLTGRTPLPQLWTLGYHQSRWSYVPEARVLEIASGFREHDIPIDVIHLDIDYMDGYRVFTWDQGKFPDPLETADKLKKQGIKIVTIIDPGVKKDKGYSIYDDGLKNNFFATEKDGLPYVNVVWPGDTVYPDFSDAPVRGWWSNNQKIMIDSGVSGIWNDMNEPASFKGELPDEVYFKNDGCPTSHKEVHNVYGHLMSKATFEGIKKYTNKRPFVITRACFAGSQKYAVVWTGDNQSFWEHLRMSIPMLMNLGLSGMAFCGSDVGGFSFDCSSELLCRWVQAACFSVLFRNHSCTGTRAQEPWAFDEETLNINRKYIKLRYKLLPYLYDLMYECEMTGLAPLRPLVVHYSEDRHVHEINDQFMFGSSMLVAPVVEQGKRYKAVYLPNGSWVDYWTKEVIEGGRIIIKDAPLDTCPIYVKAEAILPNWPPVHYVGEKTIDELILDIYPGNSNYVHYQDDGESFSYREGEYNLYEIRQAALEHSAAIKIEKTHAGLDNGYKTLKIIYNRNDIVDVRFNGMNVSHTADKDSIVFTLPACEGIIEINYK